MIHKFIIFHMYIVLHHISDDTQKFKSMHWHSVHVIPE